MGNIEKIIFNTLASRRNIGLPEIGAFVVMHASAEFTDEELAPPVNTVQFMEDWPEDTISIIDIIVGMGVEREVAEQNYSEWLKVAKSDTGAYIKGVGVLKNNRFYITKELDKYLNPSKKSVQAAVSTGRYSRTEKIWMILIPAFAIILIGGWGLWWYNEGGKKHVREESHKLEFVEPVVTTTTESTESLDAEGLVSEGAVVGDGDAKATETIPATKLVSAAKAGTTLYYVVGGVFSEPVNADNYIKLVNQAYPGLDCQKIPYKGMTMVSMFSSTSESEATNKRNKIASELYNHDIWVHKAEAVK